MAAPSHRAPDDLLRSVGNVCGFVHKRRVHPAEFEQDGRKVFRGCPRDDLADKSAAGEKDEIERQFQKFSVLLLAAGDRGHGARIEILRDKLEQHLGRRQRALH